MFSCRLFTANDHEAQARWQRINRVSKMERPLVPVGRRQVKDSELLAVNEMV